MKYYLAKKRNALSKHENIFKHILLREGHQPEKKKTKYIRFQLYYMLCIPETSKERDKSNIGGDLRLFRG
jgi:hypothetical protein